MNINLLITVTEYFKRVWQYFFNVELIYFLVMIAAFIVFLLVLKMPSGISLMLSAIVGCALGAIISGTEFSAREFFDGAFGYFDTIIVIVAAMMFISGLERSGAIEYFSALLVKAFKKFPTLLILSFMILLMLPGMITGSSISAVVSIGAIVAPILISMGLPKRKVAAIVGLGAILGMVAPPVNVPVIAICDVLDIPYVGFDMPLLLLTVPVAITASLFLSRSYSIKNVIYTKDWLEKIIITVISFGLFIAIDFLAWKETSSADDIKYDLLNTLIMFTVAFMILIVIVLFLGKPYSSKIDEEEMKKSIDFNILKELKPTVLIPLGVVIVLFVLQTLLPSIVGMFGSTLIFLISTVFTFFFGRKFNILLQLKDATKQSLGAATLLLGVGMFVQVMTLIGVRGYITNFALSFKSPYNYISMIIAMPLFGGISSFGSASILGGPYITALMSKYYEVIIASALSLIAACGEFLPPTAMSSTFATKQVGEEGYIKTTKEALIPILVTLAYSLAFILYVGKYWN